MCIQIKDAISKNNFKFYFSNLYYNQKQLFSAPNDHFVSNCTITTITTVCCLVEVHKMINNQNLAFHAQPSKINIWLNKTDA